MFAPRSDVYPNFSFRVTGREGYVGLRTGIERDKLGYLVKDCHKSGKMLRAVLVGGRSLGGAAAAWDRGPPRSLHR